MQYSDKEINEILIHEQTHVRELHSLDIILVQLVILLCWFNPFSWLIRSEIRMNHEYLADKQVVTSRAMTRNRINIICWELNILHWLQQTSITTLVYYP